MTDDLVADLLGAWSLECPKGIEALVYDDTDRGIYIHKLGVKAYHSYFIGLNHVWLPGRGLVDPLLNIAGELKLLYDMEVPDVWVATRSGG